MAHSPVRGGGYLCGNIIFSFKRIIKKNIISTLSDVEMRVYMWYNQKKQAGRTPYIRGRCMASVTQRITKVQQPYGGYLSMKLFSKRQFDDGCYLNDSDNIHPKYYVLPTEFTFYLGRKKAALVCVGAVAMVLCLLGLVLIFK